MSMLLAVNDGIANNNWNEADVCFLVGLILGALAAIAYAAGVGTVAHAEDPEPGPEPTTTTTRPVMPPRQHPWAQTWHYRFHEVAAALLALAVAAVSLGLFLQ